LSTDSIARYPLDVIVDGLAIFTGKRRVGTLPPGADARYLLGIVRNLGDEPEGIAITEELLHARDQKACDARNVRACMMLGFMLRDGRYRPVSSQGETGRYQPPGRGGWLVVALELGVSCTRARRRRERGGRHVLPLDTGPGAAPRSRRRGVGGAARPGTRRVVPACLGAGGLSKGDGCPRAVAVAPVLVARGATRLSQSPLDPRESADAGAGTRAA